MRLALTLNVEPHASQFLTETYLFENLGYTYLSRRNMHNTLARIFAKIEIYMHRSGR